MVALLKTFGKGVLYVLGLPFFILALLIFGIIGLFAFLFLFFRSIIYFFTGQKFFPELPEDKELRLLKQNKNTSEHLNEPEPEIITPYEDVDEVEPEPVIEPTPEEPAQEETVSPTIEEACFKPSFEEESEQEEIVEEEIHEEGLNDLLDDEPEDEQLDTNIPIGDEEHTILETAEEKESEEDLVEELETYVPRSSNYADDYDDEDTDMGVDIKYDTED